MLRSVEELIALMPQPSAIQSRQTRYRKHLADWFNLADCRTVLEIGCGQGDMTLVLADAMAPDGRVLAIDPAEGTYGAPLTLAESQSFLKSGPLGANLEFRLRTSVVDLAGQSFDAAVLVHSLWYFREVQISTLFDILATLTARVYIAEWDIDADPTTPAARASQVQGLVSACHPTESLNVRSPWTVRQIHQGLEKAGFDIERTQRFHFPELDDGNWEVAQALDCLPEILPHLPPGIRARVASELTFLEPYRGSSVTAMPSHGLVASRR